MRKAARTVKPNARTGERHTWKDRERRRKEERQRMAAEALIVEDAYQKGYAGLTEGYCILGIRVTDYTGKVSETDTESGAEHE